MAKKEQLDGWDRRLFTAIASRLSYDTRIFSERLRQEIDRLRKAGVGEQQIITILTQDFNNHGRIFGELRNSVKRGVIGGINQAFRRFGDMGGSLKWVAISYNLCPDCKKRAGEVDTWEGWEARGMPASGWSICKEYCYCQLIPVRFDVEDVIKL